MKWPSTLKAPFAMSFEQAIRLKISPGLALSLFFVIMQLERASGLG
jgi:hypothetical protein